MRLPIHTKASRAVEPVPRMQPPAAQILFICADARSSSYWGDLLNSRDFAVAMAQNAEAVRAFSARGSSHIIVIAVCDDALNCVDLCRRLRGWGVSVPILMYDVNGTLDDLIAAFEAGADAYVRGIEEEMVLAQIGALTRRHLPSSAAALKPAPVRASHLSV